MPIIRRVVLATSLLVAAALAACAGGPEKAPPTPYSAEEIRDTNPPGTQLLYRIDQGGQVIMETIHFVEGDAEGSVIETTMRDESGALLGEPVVADSSWAELRDHAAFPGGATTRDRATCVVPAGHFACWYYVVEGDENGERTTSRYWFADTRPGPPVCMEIESAGEVAFRMVLVEAGQ